MNDFLRTDPVITISTSTKDKCAIGIIRITGFSNVSEFSKTIRSKHSVLKARYSYLVKLVDRSENLLDEGILIYYEAPHSYTGENVIELQLHGNPINLEIIVRHFLAEYDLKLAVPGEFTYRAYKNKKLTLSQVEGLDQVLNSSSAIGIRSGLSTLNGELHNKYIDLRDKFYKFASAIELSIDFSDDVGEEYADEMLKSSFINLKNIIYALKQQSTGSLNTLTAPMISLIGMTNAGKSTLFNKLLGNERSIVSNIEGTTRDFISEYIYINNNPFRLVDTAGLRTSTDAIELEGIKRTKVLESDSYVKVYVCNPFIETKKNFNNIISNFDYIIFTNSDLPDFNKVVIDFHRASNGICSFKTSKNGPIEPLNISYNGPIEPESTSSNGPIEPENTANIGPIEPSNINSNGPIGPTKSFGPMGPLEHAINIKYLEDFSESMISIERHKAVIERLFSLVNDIDISCDISDLGLISHKSRALRSPIEELIGVVSPDSILNNIFSNFCIGK